MTTPYSSRLRYVDATDVRQSPVSFDGLAVHNASDTKLGSVDGLIFDTTTGLLCYVVIDSGGWFRSRQYLLPVGHARLDVEGKVLRVDLEQDTLKQYPEFNPDTFAALSDEDLRRFEQETVKACCPEDSALGENPLVWGYERWRHYRQPDWWQAPSQVETLKQPIPPSA